VKCETVAHFHFKVGRALPRRPIFPSRAHSAGRKTRAHNFARTGRPSRNPPCLHRKTRRQPEILIFAENLTVSFSAQTKPARMVAYEQRHETRSAEHCSASQLHHRRARSDAPRSDQFPHFAKLSFLI
jgi:hypothetical protein